MGTPSLETGPTPLNLLAVKSTNLRVSCGWEEEDAAAGCWLFSSPLACETPGPDEEVVEGTLYSRWMLYTDGSNQQTNQEKRAGNFITITDFFFLFFPYKLFRCCLNINKRPGPADLARMGYGTVAVGAEVVDLGDFRNVRLVWGCPGKRHLSAIVPLMIGKTSNKVVIQSKIQIVNGMDGPLAFCRRVTVALGTLGRWLVGVEEVAGGSKGCNEGVGVVDAEPPL